MPSTQAVLRWLADHEDFRTQYARAREAQADALAEEILDISDDRDNDYITNDDGKEVLNSEHVQRSRLRVDARKWYASKVAPKKYGDKVELSSDPDRPLVIERVERVLIDPKG